jgi:hypothetical protein
LGMVFLSNIEDTLMELDNLRKRILRFLASTVLAANILAIVVLMVVDLALRPWLEYRGAPAYNYAAALLMILGSAVALFFNRRDRIDEAGYILVGLVFLGTTISYLPKNVVSHGVVIFASSVMLSSILLHPAYSFLMTTLCGFIIAIVDTGILGKKINPFSILVLFIIAIISWLACKIMKEAIVDLQKSNAKLKAKAEDQHRELLRIVNDFAFLADDRENAIVLFGPDGNPVFMNKVALKLRNSMSDETFSKFQAIIDRAWQKNVCLRANNDGYQVEIASSLIDTDGGTYLLIQAVRLPDEESGRSLKNWQQKLAALPAGVEFDPRTGKMRVTAANNGKTHRRVVFELRSNTLVIENPLDHQEVRFDLDDLIDLAIRS